MAVAKPIVEVLTFAGCPHAKPAIDLVERVAGHSSMAVQIRLVNVTSGEAAREHRFLGSPSIHVNGRDIEPGAETRNDFGLSCRVYATSSGIKTVPDEQWLLDALAGRR